MSDADYIAKISKEIRLSKPLDSEMVHQTIEEGLKHIISKTQENCRLTKVYQKKWDPSNG